VADESILRLRIEADTTGLTSGLNKAEGELGQLATETRKVEQQLEETAAAADKAASRFMQLGDASHMSFGKMSLAFTGATVAGNALLAALDGLTRAIAAPVLEILDAEESAALLAGTFQGLQSEIDKVITLAKELSAIGPIFDDDNLSRAAAQLRLFGANANAIEELLPYINNLAMAFGIDVADAATLVGQALNGQTRALARLVPEMRTATSQAEVLAAIQGTAARNAQIAEQRMAGLGGQLALVKRQLGDAAQAFGNILLPAMQGVLSFINANMMPAFGKLAGALVGLQTYFSSLGKGFDLSEITRRVGEAIIKTEESFAKVEPRILATAVNVTKALGGLTLQGTFVGGAAAGGGRAAAGPRGVSQYGEPIGPAVPSRMRYESVTEDERVAEAKAKERLRFQDEARKADLAAGEQLVRMQAKWLEEEQGIRDDIAKRQLEASKQAAQGFADVLVHAVQGDFTGALSEAVSVAGKGVAGAIRDDLPLVSAVFGDAVGLGLEAAAPAVGGVFSKIVKAGLDTTMQAAQTIIRGLQDTFEKIRNYAKEGADMLGRASISLSEAQLKLAGATGRLTEGQVKRAMAGGRAGQEFVEAFGLPGDVAGRAADDKAGATPGLARCPTPRAGSVPRLSV
jgi:hypothetical protein